MEDRRDFPGGAVREYGPGTPPPVIEGPFGPANAHWRHPAPAFRHVQYGRQHPLPGNGLAHRAESFGLLAGERSQIEQIFVGHVSR